MSKCSVSDLSCFVSPWVYTQTAQYGYENGQYPVSNHSNEKSHMVIYTPLQCPHKIHLFVCRPAKAHGMHACVHTFSRPVCVTATPTRTLCKFLQTLHPLTGKQWCLCQQKVRQTQVVTSDRTKTEITSNWTKTSKYINLK